MLSRVVGIFVVSSADEVVDAGESEKLLATSRLWRDRNLSGRRCEKDLAIFLRVLKRVKEVRHVPADVGIDVFPVSAHRDPVFVLVAASVGEEQMGVGDVQARKGFSIPISTEILGRARVSTRLQPWTSSKVLGASAPARFPILALRTGLFFIAGIPYAVRFFALSTKRAASILAV
jgi:hypothetical protein